jgi:hypothetical protein
MLEWNGSEAWIERTTCQRRCTAFQAKAKSMPASECALEVLETQRPTPKRKATKARGKRAGKTKRPARVTPKNPS